MLSQARRTEKETLRFVGEKEFLEPIKDGIGYYFHLQCAMTMVLVKFGYNIRDLAFEDEKFKFDSLEFEKHRRQATNCVHRTFLCERFLKERHRNLCSHLFAHFFLIENCIKSPHDAMDTTNRCHQSQMFSPGMCSYNLNTHHSN